MVALESLAAKPVKDYERPKDEKQTKSKNIGSQKFGVLILAGGGSRRFGKDKALYPIDGKPMIEHVLKRVSFIAEEVVISCRSECNIFEEMYPSAMIIKDKWERKGPLTGILSSLPSMKSSYVAIVTCDCPKIKPRVIEEILHRAKGHDAAIPRWPNGYVEPLQAVYSRKETIKAAKKTWSEEKMKMTEILKRLPNLVHVSTEELRRIDSKLESFLNINRIEDVQKLSNSQN